MIIGVPKETKVEEYRVGLTPYSAHELIHHGHSVVVESNAGVGIGFEDQHYTDIGATVLPTAAEVFEQADMIIKVKEPQPQEFRYLQPKHILFTYLHLAANRPCLDALLASGCTAIAYETVTDADNHLPLLLPMSQVAGRLAFQAGAHYLEKPQGGRGILLGGLPGVYPGKVVILGGGVVGRNALHLALPREAVITVLDKSMPVLERLNEQFPGKLNTIYATAASIAEEVITADLVVGAVLVPGATAPKVVPESVVADMMPGSVIVDVAIDQGGCIETSHPTTHEDPIFIKHNVVHYCVANMPGAVPRTATLALNNATLPFILDLANRGVWPAVANNPHLAAGVNVCQGQVTHEALANDLGLPYVPVSHFN